MNVNFKYILLPESEVNFIVRYPGQSSSVTNGQRYHMS